MAISNNSTGLRPGVCLSTTRPTAPYEGQMIYETDTDLTYIWGGAAWQQVSGGTAVGNSGLVYITSVAGPSPATATITINNAFNSTYDNYQVVISGMTCSNANGDVRVKFENVLSTYNWAGIYQAFTSPATVTGTGGNATSVGITFAASETAGNFSASFDVLNPNKATATVVTATHANLGYRVTYGGIMTTATAYTTMIFTQTGANTFSGGTIAIYGYRKA